MTPLPTKIINKRMFSIKAWYAFHREEELQSELDWAAGNYLRIYETPVDNSHIVNCHLITATLLIAQFSAGTWDSITSSFWFLLFLQTQSRQQVELTKDRYSEIHQISVFLFASSLLVHNIYWWTNISVQQLFPVRAHLSSTYLVEAQYFLLDPGPIIVYPCQ